MSRHPRSLIERAVQDGDERSVSRGRVVVACLAALLVAATTLELLLPPADLGELVRAVVAGALVAALVAHDQVERRLALRRAAEAEGFTRILQGLSRSVSPEAVVAAIVEELRVTSGADHIVVARLRPEERVVEATLVSAGAGTPASTTRFPATLLEPEGRGLSRAPVPVMADAVRPLATIGPAASGRLAVGTAETAGLAVAQAQGMAPAPGTAETAGLAVAQAQGMAPAPGTAAAPGTPATAPAGALPVSAGAGAGRAVTAAATTEQAAALEIAERIAERVGVAYGLRHTLAAPLQADRRTVGALVLSRRTGEPWTVGSRRLLEAAAQEVSAALERAYAHAEAEAGAKLDALTGLPNRRHFDELATLLAHGRREGDALGVLMVDIDHFKRLNDSYGHATGDVVLREVAGAIVATIRTDDTPARFGGEEFVVLLRRAGTDIAVEVAERIRAAVAELHLDEHGVAERVTVSVGAAVADARGLTVSDLVERADAALYAAKRRGRDQVVVG